MNQHTKATSLPWRISITHTAPRFIRDSDGVLIGEFYRRDNMNVPDVIGGNYASFAIQAVNEYEALCAVAEAAKRSLSHDEFTELKGWSDLHTALANLEAIRQGKSSGLYT